MPRGATRRRLSVVKLRGIKFRTGFHDFVIDRGGLTVFPRLIAAQHRDGSAAGTVRSAGHGNDRLADAPALGDLANALDRPQDLGAG